MRHRSPARWLAPLALVAAAAAVYAIATSATKDGGDGSTIQGRSATERQVTRTTRTTAPRRRTYTVKPGDTLSSIAARYGLAVDELQQLNPDVDAQTLTVGQKLKLR